MEIPVGSIPLRQFTDENSGYRPTPKWGMLALGVVAFVLGCDQNPDSTTKNSGESFNIPPSSTTTALRSDLGGVLDLLRSGPTGA
ncbi:MAG: hypothetical protein VX126_05955, partial [Planctomycetota bacterium]|nr:hypothetical protein [Planctomycetota bacterium]